jgi:hypothetical protein
MEEWRLIQDFPEYEVSNLGRVKGGRWGHIKKPIVDRDGYTRVNLYKNKIAKLCAIHRLVASAFLNNSENKPDIDHINRIKDDNHIDNLRWVTKKENEDNKPRGSSGEKYITFQDKKYFRVTIGERKTFKTLKEAIAYRDSILHQTSLPTSSSTSPS